MGTNTDPYQWVEGRYKLMRGIWEAMRDFANPCSILTKSPLLLRDKDLLLEIAERTQVSACLSVPTLEEKAWRATEPHTPHPRARLEAVAELNRIGIPTGILIAPLMPGINDQPEQVRQDRRAGHRGRRRPHRRPDAVPARLGEGDLLRLAARAPARSAWSATSGCTRAARTCRPTSGARSSARPARPGRPAAERSHAAAGHRPPAARPPREPRESDGRGRTRVALLAGACRRRRSHRAAGDRMRARGVSGRTVMNLKLGR